MLRPPLIHPLSSGFRVPRWEPELLTKASPGIGGPELQFCAPVLGEYQQLHSAFQLFFCFDSKLCTLLVYNINKRKIDTVFLDHFSWPPFFWRGYFGPLLPSCFDIVKCYVSSLTLPRPPIPLMASLPLSSWLTCALLLSVSPHGTQESSGPQEKVLCATLGCPKWTLLSRIVVPQVLATPWCFQIELCVCVLSSVSSSTWRPHESPQWLHHSCTRKVHNLVFFFWMLSLTHLVFYLCFWSLVVSIFYILLTEAAGPATWAMYSAQLVLPAVVQRLAL